MDNQTMIDAEMEHQMLTPEQMEQFSRMVKEMIGEQLKNKQKQSQQRKATARRRAKNRVASQTRRNNRK